MNALEILQDIEHRFPVNDWTMGGERVWPFIRFLLGEHLAPRRRQSPPLPKLTGIGRALRALLGDIWSFVSVYFLDAKHNGGIRGARVLFLFNGGYRILVDGSWIVKHAYPIMRILNQRRIPFSCIENVGFGNLRFPRQGSSRIISVSLLRKLNKVRRFFKRPRMNQSMERYDSFLEYLFELDIRPDMFQRDRIISGFETILGEAAFFERLLRAHGPQAVFAIGYYAFAWGMNIACRRLGIISCDIQHGVAGEFFHPYGSWSEVPSSGYSMLPEYFLSWNHEDSEAVMRWAGNTGYHRALVLGNTWLDFCKIPGNDFCRVYERQITDFKARHEVNRIVLFTHQPTLGFPAWLLDAIAESPQDVFWAIRLHPTSSLRGDRLIALMRKFPRIDYKFFSTIPLPALLRQTDMHVTGWSATAYEAAEFDLPTVFVDPAAERYFSPSFIQSHCQLAYDKKALLNIIAKKTRRFHSDQAADQSTARILGVLNALDIHSEA